MVHQQACVLYWVFVGFKLFKLCCRKLGLFGCGLLLSSVFGCRVLLCLLPARLCCGLNGCSVVRFFSIAPSIYSTQHRTQDRPSIGTCNEPLLGSKYEGLP